MSENLNFEGLESSTCEGPICPACENGDHEDSSFCEADYRCACFCHEFESGPKSIESCAKQIIALRAKTPLEYAIALGDAKTIAYQILRELEFAQK